MNQNYRLSLAGHQKRNTIDKMVRDACMVMTRSLDSVPPPIRAVVYDMRRAEPRRPHLLGHFPNVAFTCATYGAPFHDVVAPLREMESAIRATCYPQSLPPLNVAQERETVAQGIADPVQIRLAEDARHHVAIEAREALTRHRDELNVLLAVLDGMIYGTAALQLIA